MLSLIEQLTIWTTFSTKDSTRKEPHMYKYHSVQELAQLLE